MAYDYDKLYGETRDALGAPTDVFVAFFDRFEKVSASVLDLGCGQGRDALFIARKGHTVTGVDLSPKGIRDLLEVAEREQLPVEGVVADIVAYRPDGVFDVIVIDRTLHVLDKTDRLAVLESLLDHVASGGWLLIADETSNMAAFEQIVSLHDARWTAGLRRRGYLFIQRD